MAKLVEKTVERIRFGKSLIHVLPKIQHEIQKQLASIGKTFEAEHNLINVENLRLWTDWAALHLMTLAVTFFQVDRITKFGKFASKSGQVGTYIHEIRLF